MVFSHLIVILPPSVVLHIECRAKTKRGPLRRRLSDAMVSALAPLGLVVFCESVALVIVALTSAFVCSRTFITGGDAFAPSRVQTGL